MSDLGEIDRELFDVDPRASTSARTLLVTVPPEGAGVGAEIDFPEPDPFWTAMEAVAEKRE